LDGKTTSKPTTKPKTKKEKNTVGDQGGGGDVEVMFRDWLFQRLVQHDSPSFKNSDDSICLENFRNQFIADFGRKISKSQCEYAIRDVIPKHKSNSHFRCIYYSCGKTKFLGWTTKI
jgi:hypothetical protein